MYARVTTAHVRADKIGEAISIARESVAPVVKEQQGFMSMLLLTDPDTGKGLAITLWETEEDMRAGEASGYVQQQYGKLAGVLAGPPISEHFEVSVRESKVERTFQSSREEVRRA